MLASTFPVASQVRIATDSRITAERSRGVSAIPITQTTAESANAAPMPADVPHDAHAASVIAAPPNPAPSVPSESVNCIDEDTVPAEWPVSAWIESTVLVL
jgi:hypothetical protein